jgi:hypothetical protein
MNLEWRGETVKARSPPHDRMRVDYIDAGSCVRLSNRILAVHESYNSVNCHKQEEIHFLISTGKNDRDLGYMQVF